MNLGQTWRRGPLPHPWKNYFHVILWKKWSEPGCHLDSGFGPHPKNPGSAIENLLWIYGHGNGSRYVARRMSVNLICQRLSLVGRDMAPFTPLDPLMDESNVADPGFPGWDANPIGEDTTLCKVIRVNTHTTRYMLARLIINKDRPA